MNAAHVRAEAAISMSPEYVRPYVKAQKNDDHDAEGIAEAATRPTMRFVELKNEAQLDMQILHRATTDPRSSRMARNWLIREIRSPTNRSRGPLGSGSIDTAVKGW